LTELVYGTLRWRGRLDRCIERHTPRSLRFFSVWTRNALRLGAYQILFLTRIPPSAAVNESVALAKQKEGPKPAGLVNAVLRKIAAEREQPLRLLPDDPAERIAIEQSHPVWLVRRWVERYGPKEAEDLCRSNNAPPPLTVRVNRIKTDRDRLRARLEAAGVRVSVGRCSEDALLLEGRVRLDSLKAFREGQFTIQDEAAQLVTRILDPQPGETVLDACAAPGGKTTHIAERMQNRGSIIAVDKEKGRIARLNDNIARHGAPIIQTHCADITFPGRLRNSGRVDRMLVDAPCSGTGVLRRNPEGKWLKREKDLIRFQALQRRILDGAAPMLRPGGILVYSTCSTEPEENALAVRGFLDNRPEFQVQDIRPYLPPPAAGLVTAEGFLDTALNPFGMDGFFVARFVKANTP
jgi:16S rRNA (cytosine967-C5)-methyltransferase